MKKYFNYVDEDGNEFEIEVNDVFLDDYGDFINPVNWRIKQYKELRNQQETRFAESIGRYNGQKWHDYNVLSSEDFLRKYGEEYDS